MGVVLWAGSILRAVLMLTSDVEDPGGLFVWGRQMRPGQGCYST